MSFDFGALAGVGVSAATGNYIGAAVGAVGLGMSIFGGLSGMDAESKKAEVAQKQAAVSKDIAGQEQGINVVKQQQMELEGRRMQLENMRNTQRARAQSLAVSVNQGAQLGSGFQGAQAQMTDQGNFNAVGVNSALESGRSIAGYNGKISEDKMQMAQLGGDMASLNGDSAIANGIASLGGSIIKAGPVIGQFSQGFGTAKPASNYSGTPGASNTGGLY